LGARSPRSAGPSGFLAAAFADVVDTHRRPDGEVRWLSAGIFDDGRREVEALGEPQPVEEAERPSTVSCSSAI
jgi:hypothetical protein